MGIKTSELAAAEPKTVLEKEFPRLADRVRYKEIDLDRVLPTMTLGNRLAFARARAGWTQRELSERVGKSRATIVQYEQDNLLPPIHQIERMAKELDVAPEFIAFGRQGLTGLTASSAHVISLPEIEMGPDGGQVIGGYALPQTLVEDLGIAGEGAGVYKLNNAAQAFGYEAGDRIIVNPDDTLSQEHQLYALKTRRGIEIVRIVPNLSTRSDAVKLNDGMGESHSYERDELTVLGRIVGSLRSR